MRGDDLSGVRRTCESDCVRDVEGATAVRTENGPSGSGARRSPARRATPSVFKKRRNAGEGQRVDCFLCKRRIWSAFHSGRDSPAQHQFLRRALTSKQLNAVLDSVPNFFQGVLQGLFDFFVGSRAIGGHGDFPAAFGNKGLLDRPDCPARFTSMLPH